MEKSKFKRQRATARIHFRVQPDFKKKLEKMSANYEVSLSEMIVSILQEKVKKEMV